MEAPQKDNLATAQKLVETQFADLRQRSARLTEALATQYEALRKLDDLWAGDTRGRHAVLEHALQSNALAGKRALSLGRNLPRLQTRLQDLFRVQETEEIRHRRMETLYTVIAAVNSSLDLDEVFSLALNAIVRVTGAERAFLMVRDSSGELALRAARNVDAATLSDTAFEISRSVIERVAASGKPVATTNAQEDPRFSAQASVISFSLRSILCVPLRLRGEVQGVIYADNRIRAGVFSSQERDLLMALADQIAVALENAQLFAETEQRLQEMNAVHELSQAITRTLDLERVLQQITEEVLRCVSAADKAVLHLLDDEGTHLIAQSIAPVPPITSNPPSHLTRDQGLAGIALNEQRTLRVNDTRKDNRFVPRNTDIRSLVVAPLIVGDKAVGTLTADSKQVGAFTAGNERFLDSLATQAAIAIENARLFADLKQKIYEIATMKNYMDDVFSSIASGVITLDMNDRVVTFNHAAEQILQIVQEDILHKPFSETLDFLVDSALSQLIAQVKSDPQEHLDYMLDRNIPKRGMVNLWLHLSPLCDSAQNHTGVAIVVDDLTQQRALEQERERIRQMFQLYVAPSVVRRLLADSSQLRLGGTRKEVTVLFADIRGFSTFSHTIPPEQLVDTLNTYLGLAADAVLAEEGTLDKFMGDAVMAIFNTPLPQVDHAIRAVRAAYRFQQAIATHHQTVEPDRQLSFGVGIATGYAVVGNIGTKQLRNYTAIGESVNLARRLQEGAVAGQILLDQTAYQQVRDAVQVHRLPPLSLKGWNEPVTAFELVTLNTGDRPL